MCSIITSKKRLILLTVLLLWFSPAIFCSTTLSPADSLQNLLKTCTNAADRTAIYVHLADIYTDSTQIASGYWEKALSEAIKAKDEYLIKLSLDMLIQRYGGKDKEKVKEYIDIAKKNLPQKHNKLFRAYLYCYNIWAEMRKSTSLESIREELHQLKSNSKKSMSPETQIQWEYLTGVSLDYTSLLTHAYERIPKAVPYVERALQALSAYPLEDRLHFEALCHHELADLYMYNRDPRAPEEIKKMKMLRDQWNNMNTNFQRIFLDDTSYSMSIYAQLLFLNDLISKEEATEYYTKYMRLARKKNKMADTHEASARYYQRIEDYQKAIAHLDSAVLVGCYDSINLVTVYTVKANFYVKLGDYKNAYLVLKQRDKLRSTHDSGEVQQQMVEMQTRFDVNKLQLEKIKLADRNKQMALIAAFVLLILFVSWGIYQRIMVKRLKKVHRQLKNANEEVKKQSIKATESEKMKTAFLNSICHEIRTPLNSINGFSQLLFDDSIDKDTKQEFQFLIQSNTDMLTSLMDNMLELSQLVSSELPLPVEPANVYALCRKEITLLKERLNKPGIECIFEGDDSEVKIPTNEFYLSRVIGNLLSNAAKFTENGTIILTCRKDQEKGQLIISVADTGIGIPADKQEWVFERFTKVDDFKPGTGLGLYICRIIIQRLGGSIMIDSDYAPGCKVIVILPAL